MSVLEETITQLRARVFFKFRVAEIQAKAMILPSSEIPSG